LAHYNNRRNGDPLDSESDRKVEKRAIRCKVYVGRDEKDQYEREHLKNTDDVQHVRTLQLQNGRAACLFKKLAAYGNRCSQLERV